MPVCIRRLHTQVRVRSAGTGIGRTPLEEDGLTEAGRSSSGSSEHAGQDVHVDDGGVEDGDEGEIERGGDVDNEGSSL